MSAKKISGKIRKKIRKKILCEKNFGKKNFRGKFGKKISKKWTKSPTHTNYSRANKIKYNDIIWKYQETIFSIMEIPKIKL